MVYIPHLNVVTKIIRPLLIIGIFIFVKLTFLNKPSDLVYISQLDYNKLTRVVVALLKESYQGNSVVKMFKETCFNLSLAQGIRFPISDILAGNI